MDGLWKIAELAELAAGALAAGDQPGGRTAQANGRVRDVPNERLIRWYVTVGLLDPPLSHRGRVAWYGPRHLLQLVAIKRRQAEGRSLAEIQAELAGATDASLASVARVPAATPAAEAAVARPSATAAGATGPAASAAPAPAARAAAATAGPSPGRPVTTGPVTTGPVTAGPITAGTMAAGHSRAPARFWAQRPEPPAAAPARSRRGGEEGRPATPSQASRDATGGSRDRPRLVPGVRLAPGVALLLDGAEREPEPEDLAAIAAAAGPLLEVLASTGLRPTGQPATVAAATPGSPPDDPDAPERSQA